MDFPGGFDSKESARSVGDLGSIPGSERSLQKDSSIPANHSSILAWTIQWTKPGRLQFMEHKELDTTERLTLSLYKWNVLSVYVQLPSHV